MRRSISTRRLPSREQAVRPCTGHGAHQYCGMRRAAKAAASVHADSDPSQPERRSKSRRRLLVLTQRCVRGCGGSMECIWSRAPNPRPRELSAVQPTSYSQGSMSLLLCNAACLRL